MKIRAILLLSVAPAPSLPSAFLSVRRLILCSSVLTLHLMQFSEDHIVHVHILDPDIREQLRKPQLSIDAVRIPDHLIEHLLLFPRIRPDVLLYPCLPLLPRGLIYGVKICRRSNFLELPLPLGLDADEEGRAGCAEALIPGGSVRGERANLLKGSFSAVSKPNLQVNTRWN